jgi:hypothetical protein
LYNIFQRYYVPAKEKSSIELKSYNAKNAYRMRMARQARRQMQKKAANGNNGI